MNPKRKGKKDLLITDTIDITKDTCPITFVKTKLKLESLSEGDVLEVFLREGEPVKNVPRSVQEEGHKVLTLEPHDGDIYRLVIQKQ